MFTNRLYYINFFLSLTELFFCSINPIHAQSSMNYKEVKIGRQVWMAENLNVDRFQNGDLIPQVKTNDEWHAAGQQGKPAWCYFNNNTENGARWGKLYNWYAVTDRRGLAPKGWHIPSAAEWEKLSRYLGKKAGKKLKSTSGWGEGFNGTNSTGFAGLPAGTRAINNYFILNGTLGVWWSSSEGTSSDYGQYFRLLFNSDAVFVLDDFKIYGMPVRCLRN